MTLWNKIKNWFNHFLDRWVEEEFNQLHNRKQLMRDEFIRFITKK